ncbi:hypothetical protein SK128_019323 [Halocaridina rubra]|uniref:Peptidase S1 domain-containing protein n=1 Tax=Halocaridina rubra TaxID=373956 RepID=A0AAN8WRG7_HALRR
MERANPLIRQALDKEKTVVISGISESQEPTWQGRLEENKASVVDLIRKLGVVCGPEDIVNIHQLGGGDYYSYPSQVSLTVLPLYDCERAYSGRSEYRSLFPNGLGPDTICAGPARSGHNVCQGDFGGPLMYWSNGQSVLVGIEFRSYDCDNEYQPGLYVNVQLSPYLSWIKETAFSDLYYYP